MDNPQTPTWLEIDLAVVEGNVRNILTQVGVPLMVVVKANAYGFGAVELSRVALAAGATWLAVARFGEARVLRQAGIQAPILILGGVTAPEVDEAIAERVTLNLHSLETADLYARRAREIGKPVSAHLKVDTGMGRLGVQPEEMVQLARRAQESGCIQADGLFSHFATAEFVDDPLTAVQIERFQRTQQGLNEAGFYPKWVHMCNTAGALLHPEARFTLVRVGSGVMGTWPMDDRLPYPEYLTYGVTWKARLSSCKMLPAGWGVGYGQTYILPEDELIGVVPVGYGDGFRRTTNNVVLIGGERVPVRGSVCMDQMMIHLPRRYPQGEEVVLLGHQGTELIGMLELARRWQTTQPDVTSGISLRVPRIYTGKEER